MGKKEKTALILGGLCLGAGILTALAAGWISQGEYRELGQWQASEIQEILIQAPEGGVWIFDGDWDEGISADWYAQGRGGFRSRVEGERLVLYYQENETARWLRTGDEDDLELTLRLPEGYQGSLTVEGGPGDVGLNGVEITGSLSLTAGSGTVSVYDSEIRGDMTVAAGTGEIYMGDVALEGALTVKTEGSVYLRELEDLTELTVQADGSSVDLMELEAGRIQVSTGLGPVYLEEVWAGESLCVQTGGGDVSGSLEGAMEDYSISADPGSGESNLPGSLELGDRRLEIATGGGDIQILFHREHRHED